MNQIRHLLALSLLIILTATGCKEKPKLHLAEGEWRGNMISQGVVIDIGTVAIGASSISLPDSNVYYGPLRVTTDSNNIRFKDPSDPAFGARVRMIDHETASLRISGIDGYFELAREG